MLSKYRHLISLLHQMTPLYFLCDVKLFLARYEKKRDVHLPFLLFGILYKNAPNETR